MTVSPSRPASPPLLPGRPQGRPWRAASVAPPPARSKAALPPRAVLAVVSAVVVLAVMAPAAALPAPETRGADAPPPLRPAPAAPVDINAVSEKELAALPGVSRAAAKRIIAGRPYGAVDDLARAGIQAKTIQKIRRLVVAGAPPRPVPVPDAGAQRSAPPIRGAAGPRVVQSTVLTVPPPPPRVDINHASLKELQTLPGVDAETAARIVAARPYADVEALERTGMSAAVIARLAPLASTGPEPSTAPPPRQ